MRQPRYTPADQLAIVRWQLAQLGDRMHDFRRKLVSTETTAEVRMRVVEESAQARQMAQEIDISK